MVLTRNAFSRCERLKDNTGHSPRKRKFLDTEEAPPTSTTLSEWRTHPRLKRHLLCYRRHNSGSVLRRYERESKLASCQMLNRMICHVGAWVALLPEAEAATVVDDAGLSPASLLAQLVRLRSSRAPSHPGGDCMTPWLFGILALVAHRMGEIGVIKCRKPETSAMEHWSMLWMCLPRQIQQCHFGPLFPPSLPHIDDEFLSVAGGSHAQVMHPRTNLVEQIATPSSMLQTNGCSEAGERQQGQKQLRLLSKQMARWASYSSDERDDEMHKLQKQCNEALACSDWRMMMSTLRHATAALAPPRRCAETQTHPRSTDTVSIENSWKMEPQQQAMRKIVITTLEALQNFENDDRVDRLVDYLKSMIAAFEGRVGELGDAAAATDWSALQALIDRHCSTRGEEGMIENGIAGGTRAVASQGARTEAMIADGTSTSGKQHQGATMQELRGDPTRSGSPAKAKASNPTMRGSRSNRARIGVNFDPAAKVKALPDVVHMPDKERILRCEQCASTLRSSWFYVHPRSGETSVLVPSKGHADCRRKFQRIAQFKDTDGYPTKRDVFNILDFCMHIKRRTHCVQCGGSSICAHGKFRSACRACDHLVKRRKSCLLRLDQRSNINSQA
eukprot:TRINITY_DN19737_c0_g1_i4.p1 TRINITY_DN19737_c0_g1~~TRINITY_DN19737_c0_g1_i4.p1  ORF type:complete len:618 (-),score=63.08 TRINITY_DN19737_c0_g1_i4:97-1950(-)